MVQQHKLEGPEGPKPKYGSHFEIIRVKLSYHPDFTVARHHPRVERIGDIGAQEARFFISPKNPEFSVKKLDALQRSLLKELDIADTTYFPPEEERERIRFGTIRVEDLLFRRESKTTIKEFEKGAAKEVGLKEGQTVQDTSHNVRRLTFITLYPHEHLAEIARDAEYDKNHSLQGFYLRHLTNSIKAEQLALFRRLMERRLNMYEIRDALVAKELQDDINVIVRRNPRTAKVNPQISVDF